MTSNLTYLVILGIGVMLLMVVSILLAVIYNQRKKNQHRTALEKLREQQQNQLIEAAVIGKVRGISHNLHSNILKEFGLNEAIRHFIRKVTQGTIINATTALDDNYQTENPDNDISMYRMVQELVNNTLKYANATEILISSTMDGNELNLVIFHNGDGLTQEQFEELRYQKEGLGLKNIQNRIILLKGMIHFTKGAEGSRINIQVPVKSNQHE